MKKKIFLILMILLVVITSGCRRNADMEALQNATPAVTSAPTPEATFDYSMPSLPDLDFEDMDLFEDGYEIVKFHSLSDGDTATFVVGGLPIAVRFLAVDTPEINSSTTGLEPWAMAAKEFTKQKLKEADTIILELDPGSDIFDKYDRLLAWVWVDGELLNYQLVQEGLAYVKYLYGDYRYTTVLIKLEAQAQKQKIKVWGEDDPDFDYENDTVRVDIASARKMEKGSNVILTGVVTNIIDKNAFIQDDTGAIYIYANRYNYSALEKGNMVELSGKVTEYNGLLEISSIADKNITVIEEGIEIEPMLVTLDIVNEDIEGIYIRIENLTVTDVVTSQGERGYDVHVTDGTNDGIIRVDKYLSPYPEPDEFSVGDTLDVIGNVGQYMENYQIMIGSLEDVAFK